MATTKLIKTLAPANNMDFMDMLSFETESYLGLWSHTDCHFVLIEKNSPEFRPLKVLGDTFMELDEEVFRLCNEHILYVSDNSGYKLTMCD